MLNVDELIQKIYDECPEPKEVTPNKDEIFQTETNTKLESLESTNKTLLEEIAQLKADMAKMSAIKEETE